MFSFIETKLFSRLLAEYLTDNQYALRQGALIEAPEYYAKIHEGIIWMLTIYAKNEAESIPAHTLRKIKEEIDG